MSPANKALWFVETHLHDDVGLEEIAAACHVSAFHLTRVFAAAMGLSLMRYVRARRLTEAAKRLAEDAGDVNAVARAVGYGSHEAFTRAFRDHFGVTPMQVRDAGSAGNLKLTEALPMTESAAPELATPRFEDRAAFRVAGLVERYDCQALGGIPQQWQRLGPHLGRIPQQIGRDAYGVCFNFDADGGFDYLCGVEVAAHANPPVGLTFADVPRQHYVVFRHSKHIAGIQATFRAIYGNWFPASDKVAAEGPAFELYGPEFNPTTGLGGLEIWIPVKASPTS